MLLCRECHDWQKCAHSRFIMGTCYKCKKENVTCVVCDKEEQIPPPAAK